MLEHGGRLLNAVKQYNIPLEHWIDLSTGINPHGWPVPSIPPEYFNRLPDDNDNLIETAKKYYGTDSLLPLAGSQAAIQLLPVLRKPCHVAVPRVGYAEHAHAWQQHGHIVDTVDHQTMSEQLDKYDVVVLINPNNPTGERYSVEQLLNWHNKLQKKNGWLIVDEAFMDSTPEQSLLPYTNRNGLFILRSIGKFFGLAGIRCGFVMAENKLLHQLQQSIGPWSLTGPTRYIAQLALSDSQWQSEARQSLQHQCSKLHSILNEHLITSPLLPNSTIHGTTLFQTVYMQDALYWHTELAKQGVLTRLLDHQQGIRFGLANNNHWQRLSAILRDIFSPEKHRTIQSA